MFGLVFLVILFLGLFYVLIIFFLKRSLTSAQMLFSPFFVPIWCINEWSGVLNAVVFFFLPDYSRHIWLLHWWIICVLLLISCVYIVSEKKKKKGVGKCVLFSKWNVEWVWLMGSLICFSMLICFPNPSWILWRPNLFL